MDLYDAESLLDGGTTCLTVVERSKRYYYTVDYSLPMDGRPRYVYLGNVPGTDAENTYCYHCRKLLIERYGYQIIEKNIESGKCKFCGIEIDGLNI